MDKFRVEVITKTPFPQQVIYAAMHQDYSDRFVIEDRASWPSEEKCGEIIVQRLLSGERGHYGCYSPDTEVLTRRGWVKFPELIEGEEVLAVDINSMQSHFEVPSAYQKYSIEDNIYKVEGRNISLAVTLDHRMVVSHRHKDGSWSEYYFTSADSVVEKPRRYLSSTFLKNNNRNAHLIGLPPGYKPENLFKLAGFFVGDGCINVDSVHTRFSLKQKEKIEYLYSLGFEIKENQGGRYSVVDKQVAAWLQQNFVKEKQKYIPWQYLDLSQEFIESLLEGMRVTDGTAKQNAWAYDSTSEQVLDFLQAVLHLNNKSSSYTLNNPNEGIGHENHKPCWRVHVSDKIQRRMEACQKGRSPSYSETVEKYTGEVYCVTVSTGALLVRRNRKVVVCGNCLEHPQITFNCGYFPHSVMQQARTHRVGLCLSGDTEIYFRTQEGYVKTQKISEIYQEWKDGSLPEYRLINLNEETLEFGETQIVDVYANSKKQLLTIALENGRQLTASKDHLIFGDGGWRKLEDWAENDYLASSTILYEARDGENKLGVFYSRFERIVGITEAGFEETYDIEVNSNYRNFLANNFVVHNSFDVQSFRYTGHQVIEAYTGKRDIEEVFYLRPEGYYSDRKGKKYYYSPDQRQRDLDWCLEAAKRYKIDLEHGMSEEHARGKLPFDYRQHFVVSFSLRALLHFLDLRFKKDAQLEIQQLCNLIWPYVEDWVPAVAKWYERNRLGKARLAP